MDINLQSGQRLYEDALAIPTRAQPPRVRAAMLGYEAALRSARDIRLGRSPATVEATSAYQDALRELGGALGRLAA